MKLKFLLISSLLLIGLAAKAQVDSILPDEPLNEDLLSFESDTNDGEDIENSSIIAPPNEVTTAKPVPPEESAPLEPPFTQDNEFEDGLAFEIDKEDSADPIVEAPEIEASKFARPPKAPGAITKGVELIEHPLAAKGLMRIEKDGSYIYRTKPSKHDQSATFRMGALQPPNIQSADRQTDFKSMYTQEDIPIVLFDYEWQPFSGFGKLGIQAGIGFFTAQGNGRFLDGKEAREEYTFYAIPISLGAIYRLEFMDRQWLAPYVAGGGTYFALVEMRDDNAAPHGVGTPAAYGAGGMMFNISAFDRETAFTLNSEYGISNLWVTLEYRYLQTFTDDIDLSSGMFNMGIAVDY